MKTNTNTQNSTDGRRRTAVGAERWERVPIEELLPKFDIVGMHPALDVIPEASDQEFQAMCADVKVQGFLNPVRVNDDLLLIDGRARLQVGWALGLDPAIIRFNPPDVLAYVLSENLHRKQLTAGQRASIGMEIEDFLRGRETGGSRTAHPGPRNPRGGVKRIYAKPPNH